MGRINGIPVVLRAYGQALPCEEDMCNARYTYHLRMLSNSKIVDVPQDFLSSYASSRAISLHCITSFTCLLHLKIPPIF